MDLFSPVCRDKYVKINTNERVTQPELYSLIKCCWCCFNEATVCQSMNAAQDRHEAASLLFIIVKHLQKSSRGRPYTARVSHLLLYIISVDTLADGILQCCGGGGEGSREETGFMSLPTCFSDGSVYLYQRDAVQGVWGVLLEYTFLKRDFLFLKYLIQHCFICRPPDSAVSEDARIEPRTVAILALAVRRSYHLSESPGKLSCAQRRGNIVYIEYQSVCIFVGIGPPPPIPSSPIPKRGGEEHSLADERGVGDPIRTTGQKAWHSIVSVALMI